MEREFPNFSASDFSPLDAALELWFQAPDKLAQFAPFIQAPAPQPEPSPEPHASQTEPPPCSLQPSASSLAQLHSELRRLLTPFVVLPPWAPETIALWILHTSGRISPKPSNATSRLPNSETCFLSPNSRNPRKSRNKP
jgi:hypothetical protein